MVDARDALPLARIRPHALSRRTAISPSTHEASRQPCTQFRADGVDASPVVRSRPCYHLRRCSRKSRPDLKEPADKSPKLPGDIPEIGRPSCTERMWQYG